MNPSGIPTCKETFTALNGPLLLRKEKVLSIHKALPID